MARKKRPIYQNVGNVELSVNRGTEGEFDYPRTMDISEIDFDLLYDAVTRHEHRGAGSFGDTGMANPLIQGQVNWGAPMNEDYNPFIRTQSDAGGRGSSAFGPIQLTKGMLQDLQETGIRGYYDIEGIDQDFYNQLWNQSENFLKYGGGDMPEGGITAGGEDVSMYDYGQSGVIGDTEEERENYKNFGLHMLQGSYRRFKHTGDEGANYLRDMLTEYGGESGYADKVIAHYNYLKKAKTTEGVLRQDPYPDPQHDINVTDENYLQSLLNREYQEKGLVEDEEKIKWKNFKQN